MKVMLDAHVHIWRTEAKPVPEWVEYVAQANALWAELKRLNIAVIVPTPLITELISGCSTQQRRDVIIHSMLDERIRSVSYSWDIAYRAGVMIAELYLHKQTLRLLGQWNKPVVKFDAMLAATALAEKADMLIF